MKVRRDGQLGLEFTNRSSEPMQGTFALYAEDQNGNRGESPEVTTTAALAPAETKMEVAFTPTRPVQQFVLVFQGTLGGEPDKAVAGRVQPYTLPPAVPIQEAAHLAGAAEVNSYTDRTGAGASSGTSYVQSGIRQEATGTFFPAALGKRLRRVELIFDLPPAPGSDEVVLKLNGTPVGTAWTRETGPELEPETWSVTLNLPTLTEPWPDPAHPGSTRTGLRVPRYLVAEAENGARVATPLLWSGGVWTYGTRGLYCQPCGGINLRTEEDITQTRATASVLFGDGPAGLDQDVYPTTSPHTAVGFIPLTPPAFWDTLSSAGLPPQCVEGTYAGETVSVFGLKYTGDPQLYWHKNGIDRLTLSGENTYRLAWECAPNIPATPAAPPRPAPLQYQRDYLAWEVAVMRELGIEPPAPHVITVD